LDDKFRFLPVKIEKMVSFAWDIGEPLPDRIAALEGKALFSALPESQVHENVDLYEMLMHLHGSISNRFEGLRTVQIDDGTPPETEFVDIECSKEMLLEFPVFAKQYSIVFAEWAWRRVEDLIDRRFFTIRSYSI